jgi:hypothetical protein
LRKAGKPPGTTDRANTQMPSKQCENHQAEAHGQTKFQKQNHVPEQPVGCLHWNCPG